MYDTETVHMIDYSKVFGNLSIQCTRAWLLLKK